MEETDGRYGQQGCLRVCRRALVAIGKSTPRLGSRDRVALTVQVLCVSRLLDECPLFPGSDRSGQASNPFRVSRFASLFQGLQTMHAPRTDDPPVCGHHHTRAGICNAREGIAYIRRVVTGYSSKILVSAMGRRKLTSAPST